jgi:hypothetical protein
VANRGDQSQLPTKKSNSPEQNIASRAPLEPSAATRETRAGRQEVIELPNPNEVTIPIETVSLTPTPRSGLMATWQSVSGAKGYLLDVSTSDSFSSYVDGYHDFDVGNVNGRARVILFVADKVNTYFYALFWSL